MSDVAVIACGALAADVRRVCSEQGWSVDVHPLPALLHNRPERIAPAVAAELARLRERYARVAVAYGDCGTYGALDGLEGVHRLRGETCYDVFAAPVVRDALREQPGTYFLTDFLARTFERTVWRELGLDRHPELRSDYFRHYTRVIWLAQRPVAATRAAAERAAALLGLPLEVRHTGSAGLALQLERLVGGLAVAAAARAGQVAVAGMDEPGDMTDEVEHGHGAAVHDGERPVAAVDGVPRRPRTVAAL